MKKGLSHKAKFSIYRSVNVCTLTNGQKDKYTDTSDQNEVLLESSWVQSVRISDIWMDLRVELLEVEPLASEGTNGGGSGI